MIVISSLEEAVGRFSHPVVAVGNFDGVHRGHQAIIEQAVDIAEGIDAPCIAVTFDPHPQLVLGSKRDRFLLSPLDEKLRLFSGLTLDGVVVLPFDRAFAATEPEDYIQSVYVRGFQVREIVVGFSHAFGRGGKGDTTFLRTSGLKHGFGVTVVPPFRIGEHVVGSSLIRNQISSGRIALATDLLGHPFRITGTVVRGEGRGRKLNYPTANIGQIDAWQMLPGHGVYAVRVSIRDNDYEGVMNVGVRPTFGSDKERCEIHILDFGEDIYDSSITFAVEEKIRDERKFDGIESLKQQIAKDVETAKSILS